MIDAPAHVTQLARVVPELCTRHLGPWLAREKVTEGIPGGQGFPIVTIGLGVLLWLSGAGRF